MTDGLGLSGLSLYGRKSSRKRLGKGFSTLGRTFGKSDELLEKLLRSDELSEKLWKNFYGRTNFRKSLRKGWEEVWRLRTASEKAEKNFSVEKRFRIIIGKGIARPRQGTRRGDMCNAQAREITAGEACRARTDNAHGASREVSQVICGSLNRWGLSK